MDMKLTGKWKIRIKDQVHSKEVQEWLFSQGWKWRAGQNRYINYEYIYYIHNTDNKRFLWKRKEQHGLESYKEIKIKQHVWI